MVGELHASKFSMGMLGNCWFVGACASLSQDRKAWNKVIPNWRDQVGDCVVSQPVSVGHVGQVMLVIRTQCAYVYQ